MTTYKQLWTVKIEFLLKKHWILKHNREQMYVKGGQIKVQKKTQSNLRYAIHVFTCV